MRYGERGCPQAGCPSLKSFGELVLLTIIKLVAPLGDGPRRIKEGQ